jgi:hypothetical protein
MDDMLTVPVSEYESMKALLTEMTDLLRRLNKAYLEGLPHQTEEGGRRVRNDFRRQIEADRLFASEFQKAMRAASPRLREAVTLPA